MKIALKVAAGTLAVLIFLLMWRVFSPAPQLREGDLIFQTSRSGQSNAILLATGSACTLWSSGGQEPA